MTSSASPDKASAPAGAPRQVLTFSLGAENFGVDILRVREIRGWTPVTRIPQVPPHVCRLKVTAQRPVQFHHLKNH